MKKVGFCGLCQSESDTLNSDLEEEQKTITAAVTSAKIMTETLEDKKIIFSTSHVT